ncbi:MAG: hypothetical protein Q9201_007569 [Fulgogasparrea decipioides]
MSTLAISSPLRHSHSEALTVSQQAGKYVQKNGGATSSIPLPFFSNSDSAELWTTYENLLYSCLRTGDDKAAHFCLEKLAERFGKNNERVMGLRGLYQEAMADDSPAMMQMLQEYDGILSEDPTNTPIKKRRVALLRSLSRQGDAINALIELLEASPTDIEAWAELSELYVSQGYYQQAEFCLEEILLSAPNAWNIHARLGEVLYISAATSQDQIGSLVESVRRFCRSIELCDGYLRGCYGLKLASERLLAAVAPGNSTDVVTSTGGNSSDIPIPSIETLQKLREKVTSILAESARKPTHNDPDPPDIAAAKDLLKSSTMLQQR